MDPPSRTGRARRAMPGRLGHDGRLSGSCRLRGWKVLTARARGVEVLCRERCRGFSQIRAPRATAIFAADLLGANALPRAHRESTRGHVCVSFPSHGVAPRARGARSACAAASRGCAAMRWRRPGRATGRCRNGAAPHWPRAAFRRWPHPGRRGYPRGRVPTTLPEPRPPPGARPLAPGRRAAHGRAGADRGARGGGARRRADPQPGAARAPRRVSGPAARRHLALLGVLVVHPRRRARVRGAGGGERHRDLQRHRPGRHLPRRLHSRAVLDLARDEVVPQLDLRGDRGHRVRRGAPDHPHDQPRKPGARRHLHHRLHPLAHRPGGHHPRPAGVQRHPRRGRQRRRHARALAREPRGAGRAGALAGRHRGGAGGSVRPRLRDGRQPALRLGGRVMGLSGRLLHP